MHIASAFMRVGNDGCKRAFLKGLTSKPNLCDLYDIDPVVLRARFAPLRVGEQTRLVPVSSCAAARFACRGLAIIQTRRKLARAPLCLWWCSVVRVLQYRTWPHLCCAGEHGRHQAEEWWPEAFSVDNIMA